MKRGLDYILFGSWALWPLIGAQAQEAQRVYRVGMLPSLHPFQIAAGTSRKDLCAGPSRTRVRGR